jgi:ubiquinone/menaquinone biosynthesis C-methylase UbiE
MRLLDRADDHRQLQQEFYDAHFARRAEITRAQLAHPLLSDFYDRLADRIYDRAPAAEAEGGMPRHVKLVEFGCGEGLLAAALHRRAAARGWTLEYTGADLSSAGLEYARTVVTGELLVGDAAEVAAGLPGSSADLVVMKNLLHHIERPKDLLSQVRRVIGAHGRAVVIEASLRCPHFLPFNLLAPVREKFFFAGRRRNLKAIRDAGLKVVDHEGYSLLPFELLLVSRFDWFRRLFGTRRPGIIGRIAALDETLARRMRWLASYNVWTTVAR